MELSGSDDHDALHMYSEVVIGWFHGSLRGEHHRRDEGWSGLGNAWLGGDGDVVNLVCYVGGGDLAM
jgi:hypothetical protein